MTPKAEWIEAKTRLPSQEGSYLALCYLARNSGHAYKAYRIVDVEEGALWLGMGEIKYPTILAWWSQPLPPLPPARTGRINVTDLHAINPPTTDANVTQLLPDQIL